MSKTLKRFGFARSNTDQVLETLHGSRPAAVAGSDSSLGEKDGAAVSSSNDISAVEANARLQLFEKTRRWDPNLPNDALNAVDDAVEHHDTKGEVELVDELVENSPYPEVRSAVRNYDEEMPANTIRAWVIGMIMTTLGSGLNIFFSLRSPSITITSIVAQLVAYPIGLGWAAVMPDRQFSTFGLKWNLNPGPFNLKEHALITIMANVSFGNGFGYFADTLTAQRGFYGQNFGWGFNIMLALTTQCVGFGIAGLFRKFLVDPASMIWPSTLVNCAFMYTLHDHSKTDPEKASGWNISRYRFFFYVFLGSFAWYFFPGFIAPFLSAFAFVTWIRPNNPVINQVFGGWTGISLIPITFDWTMISGYIFSPLVAPWHAIGNTLIGMVIWFWITTSAIHFSGHWYSEYLPISDSGAYDNTATTYNVSKILTPEFTLDLDKYEAYSPLFLSTTFALCYGLSFAGIAAIVVHTALFHGTEIITRAKAAHGMMDDIHTKMMRKYAQVPFWWFASFLVVMIGMCLATCLAWPTHLTWWALFIGLLISFVWTVPIGIIQATTNIQMGLNVFTEFIIGYMLPGRPLAMMLFKTYGYITMTQALAFVSDMKLGHYLKLPPRTLFMGQVVATIWSCIVQVAVWDWSFKNIEDVCSPHQSGRFTCPNGKVFFNASVIWGLIGPARMFSGDSTYAGLQYFWIVGAILPVMIYFGARMFPRSSIRYLNAPIIFSGTAMIPPATPLNYLSWGIVGWFFNKFLRSRHTGWWMRFNYITSAGLDVGLAICTILITTAIGMTNTAMPDWWGTTTALNTMDYQGTAVQKVVAEGEIFGPKTW